MVGADTGASVLLATVGRAERLPRVVDAVLGDPATHELIVVVDGPDDESARMLAELADERPRLRPVSLSRRGQLAALDEAVRMATSDVVVLLDDDVVPDPGTIGGHLARHREATGLVVAGPMPVVADAAHATSAGTRLYAAEYLAHLTAIERGEVGVLDVLWTGNLSLRRTDCRRVGLDAPAFHAHYHADRDLGYRLRAAGLTGVLDPRLTASHFHVRTDEEFLRDAARQGEGRVELHRHNAERLGPFRLHQLVGDLPAPLRAGVRVAGSTLAAAPIARALMALGRRIDASLPQTGAAVATARVARRIMQWRGARRALLAARAAGARGGTVEAATPR